MMMYNYWHRTACDLRPEQDRARGNLWKGGARNERYPRGVLTTAKHLTHLPYTGIAGNIPDLRIGQEITFL